MKINVYPQVLGGDRELMESCKDWRHPIRCTVSGTTGKFHASFTMYLILHVFENIDDARKAIDNADFQKNSENL